MPSVRSSMDNDETHDLWIDTTTDDGDHMWSFTTVLPHEHTHDVLPLHVDDLCFQRLNTGQVRLDWIDGIDLMYVADHAMLDHEHSRMYGTSDGTASMSMLVDTFVCRPIMR